jgi:hypothetical protein
MLLNFLKNIVYVFVICVFLFMIISHFVQSKEGFEGDSVEPKPDGAPTSNSPTSNSPTSNAPTSNAPTASSISELFEKVNTQSDIIRTFKGDFNPITPLKIDGSGDERIIVLNNIKLLLNNGIFKNETDLKQYEYTGTKTIGALVSEVNSLNLENPSSITDLDKKEEDFIKRAKVITDEHQKIIDLELKRRSK